MITVQELIDKLSQYNPTDIIVLAKDSEGNGYSPLDDFSENVYDEKSSYRGTIYIRKLTPGLKLQGYTEEDLSLGDKGQDCITFWPTN